MLKNTLTSYGSVTKFLHWLIFFLVATMLAAGFFLDPISNSLTNVPVYNVHKLIGITILLLMLFRLTWTLTNPKPLPPLGTPRWQKIAERVVHWLIYLALIAMPLSGWIMTSAGKHPPYLFNWILRLPVPHSEALDNLGYSIHRFLAWALIVLITIHVGAALYHYFVKKDEVLKRMMPSSKPRA